MLIWVNARILSIIHHYLCQPSSLVVSADSQFEASHSLHTALQLLSLGEMLRKFVAAGAKHKSLLHLLEQLLVVLEFDSFSVSLQSSPGRIRHFICQAQHTHTLTHSIDGILIIMMQVQLPVFSIILHFELVEDHLREPGNVWVQGMKSWQVREDAVSPWRVSRRECRGLGCHVVAFNFPLEQTQINKYTVNVMLESLIPAIFKLLKAVVPNLIWAMPSFLHYNFLALQRHILSGINVSVMT